MTLTLPAKKQPAYRASVMMKYLAQAWLTEQRSLTIQELHTDTLLAPAMTGLAKQLFNVRNNEMPAA